MSISQKIGIWLYRNIDKGFIYQILKDLHKNSNFLISEPDEDKIYENVKKIIIDKRKI